MESEKKKVNQFIQVGYFVDYPISDKYIEYEIAQIENNKIIVKNVKEQSTTILDISTNKIKPYRTHSRPNEATVFYHRRYNYWSDGILQVNEALKKLINSPSKFNNFTDIQLVQLLRGKNYFVAMSLTEGKHVTEQRLTILTEYVELFLLFFQDYWKGFNVNESFDPKHPQPHGGKLYKSEEAALMFCYPEVLIALSIMFGRNSILVANLDQNQTQDNLMRMQLQWMQSNLVTIVRIKNAGLINLDISIKLIVMFVKLLNNKAIQQTQQMHRCLQHLFDCVNHFISRTSSFPRFSENQMQLRQLENVVNKKSVWFLHWIVAKIKLYLKFLDLQPELFGQADRQTKLLKNMIFIKDCLDYQHQPIRQLIDQYLSHQNGLAFYLKHFNISNHLIEFHKLYSYCPQFIIKEAVRVKKIDILKAINKWSGQLIKILNQSYFQYYQLKTKQSITFTIEVYKIISNQLRQVVDEKNKKKQQRCHQKIPENAGKQQSIQTIIDQKSDLKLMALQRDTIIIAQSLQRLQSRIIQLFEQFCNADQKTMLMEYVQKNVLPKYIKRINPNISQVLEVKETNTFKQKYIIKQYINRVANNNNKDAKQISCQLINVFTKLCSSMVGIKYKQFLQFRNENLLSILNKLVTLSPQILPDLLCLYVAKIKQISNKQIKGKSFQFIIPLCNKNGVFENQHIKIECFKRLIYCVRVETFLQFKFFFQLFKIVNQSQGNIKIQEDSFMPLVIYKPLFGLQKFYEILKNCYTEKLIIKKIGQFFHKIHLKIANQELKTKMIMQLCDQLIGCLQIGFKQEITKLQQQFLTQLINLLISLLVESKDHPNNGLDYSYCELFPSQAPHINFHKNNVIIIVKFQDPSCEEQECNDSGQSKQFSIVLQATERLYSIKERAATCFQISPIQSNLYFMSKDKISVQDENQTIQYYLNKQDVIQQQSQRNRREQVLDEKEPDQQNIMQFTLKPHGHQFKAKQYIAGKLKLIFLCLPFSERLWQSLAIPVSVWSQNFELKQIKHDFLMSYKQEMGNQQNLNINLWEYIIWDRNRKKVMLQVLLNDQELGQYQMNWLFEAFSPIQEKRDIENNYLCLLLVQRLGLKISQKNATFMLQMLKIDEKNLGSTWVAELNASQKEYDELKQKTFEYIEQNSNFNHFSYMMRLKQSFYTSLINCPKIIYEFDTFFIRAFETYIKTVRGDEFTKKMQKYLEEHTMQFQYLVRIIMQNQINVNESTECFHLYEYWLKTTIIYLISKQHLWEEYQLNHRILRASMSLVACLLSKNIKSDLIFYQDFKQIISRTVFSDLCEQSIAIITSLINYSERQAEQYVRFFISEMSEPQWEKKQKISFNKCNIRSDTGFMGLKNPHSICYANSLLQQLYYINSFRQFMYATDWKASQTPEEDLILQLKKIFLNLNFRQSDSYFNSTFFQAFKNDEGTATSIEVQMDVDQFRSILFDRIQNLIIKPENQPRNFVQKVFNGKLITLIRSKQCDHQSSRQEQFSSICLEVKGLKNLHNALQYYFKPQILNEDNKYFCQECNRKVVAQKINKIKQYPNYMIFVLKRFEYIYQLRKKINDAFQFPLDTFQMSQNINYRLRGVIVHQGLSEIGHYFSLIKINKKWYQFNDNVISQVLESDVIKDSYGQQAQKCTRNAYLLIYQKIQNGNNQKSSQINQMPDMSKWPLQKGLDQQMKNIIKFNHLLWKSDLFLSHSFQIFVANAARLKIKNSPRLLLQYITTIKAKMYKFNAISHFKQLFLILDQSTSNSLLNCQFHVDCLIQFYRHAYVNQSLKTAMTTILTRKLSKIDEFVIKFLKCCIISIHDQIQTAPFYKLLLNLSKKFSQILKFIIDARIVGRIFDTTIPKLLLSCDREQLSQSTDISFPLTDSTKTERRKLLENKDLKYHKWRLLCFIMEYGNLSLTKTEQSYVYSWNDRKYQGLLDDVSTKAGVNQISRFFMLVSSKNASFGNMYLKQLCRQINKMESENARKYLRGAMELLNIQDDAKIDRLKQLKNCFAEVFKTMTQQKVMSSFDVKWQWFIKMAYKSEDFRKVIKACVDQFRIICTKSEIQPMYLARSATSSSDGKQKNKYYGLKFGNAANNYFFQQKYQRSRKIFIQDDEYFRNANFQQPDYDKDLSDHTNLSLKSGSVIMLYNDQQARFKEFVILESLGDLIQIQQKIFIDRGHQTLMATNKKQAVTKQPREVPQTD